METYSSMAEHKREVTNNARELSVAVCVKNREELIGSCLDSVAMNRPAEIIVVDGGSTDQTVEIARRYTSSIYFDGGRGLAFARQLAAERATQRYLAYVDSDVVLPANSLVQMLLELRTRGYTGIHAQVLGGPSETYWEWAQDQHFRLTFNREGAATAIGTVAAIYKRDVVLQFGFDPFMSGAEDGDLCYRLLASGYTLGVSSVRVLHRHRTDLADLVQQRLWYGQGTARLSWKHRSARILLPALLFPITGSALALAKGKPRLVPYFVVAGTIRSCAILAETIRLALGVAERAQTPP
jgi:glycosyltransferase involved in cell wall biosynthesis